MSLDITWCDGKRCKKTEQCERHMAKLLAHTKDWSQEQKEKLHVGVADFSDYDGNCVLEGEVGE